MDEGVGQKELALHPALVWTTLYILAVLFIYSGTVESMVSIWNRSDTYGHGYLIAPIVLWLVWCKRDELSARLFKPALVVQLLLIPLGMVWLLAHLIDVLVVQQLALVSILLVGIWSIVGHSAARTIAFPLVFLFLSVPMGEDLVPPMMELTAVSTVFLIELSGIPVYREGLFFTLPSGKWSVVEACSGVRYLIASFTLGLVFAYQTYSKLWKRLLFLCFCILGPLLGNIGRAYLIVMIGHFSDMELATGVDHIFYGWAFFGVMIFILFWVGSLWGDQNPPRESGARDRTAAPAKMESFLIATVIATALASFWGYFSTIIEQSNSDQTYAGPVMPGPVKDWDDLETKSTGWRPGNRGADFETVAAYKKDGRRVALHFQQYFQQQEGAEVVIGRPQQIIKDREKWRVVSTGKTEIRTEEQVIGANEVLVTDGLSHTLVWYWYRIGERHTASSYSAKLYQALETVFLGRPDSALILVATDYGDPERNQGEASRVLQSFVVDFLHPIENSLDRGLQ